MASGPASPTWTGGGFLRQIVLHATEHRMDQMAALSHLRALIKAAKGKNDVEALHRALHEMLLFVEKSLGRKG
jgi:hypothetical protein